MIKFSSCLEEVSWGSLKKFNFVNLVSFYIAIYIFIINCSVFYLYKFNIEFYPIFFVFKTLFNMDWIIDKDFLGFVSFMAFLFMLNLMLISMINNTLSKTSQRLIVSIVFIIANFELITLYIPLSLTLLLSYIVLLGVVVGSFFFRLLNPYIELESMKSPQKTYDLLHAEWLQLLQQSIWGLITIVIGATASAIQLLNATGMKGFIGAEWGYTLGQLIIIGVVMTLAVIGLGTGVTLYCHDVLKEIRRRKGEH